MQFHSLYIHKPLHLPALQPSQVSTASQHAAIQTPVDFMELDFTCAQLAFHGQLVEQNVRQQRHVTFLDSQRDLPARLLRLQLHTKLAILTLQYCLDETSLPIKIHHTIYRRQTKFIVADTRTLQHHARYWIMRGSACGLQPQQRLIEILSTKYKIADFQTMNRFNLA